MNPKILVADDSPTIQKVVSITLAGKDYQLEAAHNESELFKKLGSGAFDLVLLDFNISEEFSGYDLAKKIKEKAADTKILVMLGTFDSVDDHSMNEAGVIDQIVKPFESSLFVDKVKAALEGESSFSSSSDPVNLESNESEWVMDNAAVEDDEDDDEEELSFEGDSNDDSDANPLSEVISGWGMSVPSVIGEESSLSYLPPKMKKSALVEGSELAQQIIEDENFEESPAEVVMPGDDELDYPELDIESEEKLSTKLTSKLVSLDDLDSDDIIDLDDDDDIDETDPQFVIEQRGDSSDLLNALEDDISPDEFWAADQDSEVSLDDDELDEKSEEDDESESTSPEINLIDLGEEDDFQVDQHVSVSIGAESEEISSPTIDALNSLNGDLDIGPKLERESVSFDYEEILSKLKKDLKPMIKELVQEIVDQSNTEVAEKVAWEIIPDLAENLIRKEVESLSKKVQNKHSLS